MMDPASSVLLALVRIVSSRQLRALAYKQQVEIQTYVGDVKLIILHLLSMLLILMFHTLLY